MRNKLEDKMGEITAVEQNFFWKKSVHRWLIHADVWQK